MTSIPDSRQPREDPWEVLGVSLEAGDEEVRAAYLRKVKEHPPDRSPREFERIRDAYYLLRDPRRRIEHMLLAAEPDAPLVSLLDDATAGRRYLGPAPWLEAMRRS